MSHPDPTLLADADPRAAKILAPVTCASCRAPFELGILFHAEGAPKSFSVGDALPVDLNALAAARTFYVVLSRPTQAQLLVLECNDCSACGNRNWFGLVIDAGKLTGVWPVVLNPAAFARTHVANLGGLIDAAEQVLGRDVTPEQAIAHFRGEPVAP